MGTTVALVIVAAAVAALITWLALRAHTAAVAEKVSTLELNFHAADADAKRLRDANAQLREEMARVNATLTKERESWAEKLALLQDAEEKLRDAFKALAADALKSNSQAFLELANTRLETAQQSAKSDLDERRIAIEGLLRPVSDSLGQVSTELGKIEVARVDAYARLEKHLESLTDTQQELHLETGKLVSALRTPHVKGRWGEIQLRRVVEMAGMLPYCDFDQQVSVDTDDGRLRPDLIVKLPGKKNIVVDSKAPTNALIEAYETQDEKLREDLLAKHAALMRTHMAKLSSKAYWEQFPTPEFVVMFLPGETFFSQALQQDPGLIEEGVSQKVIPASPMTLIALLRAVAYGWQQERIAESAQQISDLGSDLYERLRVLAGHFDAVGKGLERAVESYNKAVGSLESRVLITARKFPELGTSINEDIPEVPTLEITVRALEAPELRDEVSAASALPRKKRPGH